MKKIKKLLCLLLGHKYTTAHPYKGYASLDGYYTKAVCIRCGKHLTARY